MRSSRPLTPDVLPVKGEWSAWGMSLGMHALLVVVLALVWRSAPARGGGGEEGPRRAAIAIADIQDDGTMEYFSESQAEAQSAAAAAAGGLTLEQALPPSATEIPAPDIELPGQVQATSPTGGAAGPNLGVGPRNDAVARIGGEDLEAIIRADQAKMGPPPPTGPKAQLTLFGSPSEGRSFVFVIDRSKSMGGAGLNALTAARQELELALRALSPRQKLDVIAYNQTAVQLSGTVQDQRGLLPADEKTIGQVPAFIDGLAAFGATYHNLALHAALNLKPEVIYLLTDGGDPYLTPAELQEITARARNTTIHCLQFGSGPRQEENRFMEILASRTGGTYRYVNMAQYRLPSER